MAGWQRWKRLRKRPRPASNGKACSRLLAGFWKKHPAVGPGAALGAARALPPGAAEPWFFAEKRFRGRVAPEDANSCVFECVCMCRIKGVM